MNTFEKTQELRQLAEDLNYPIAFACYKCGCDTGSMVFDARTQTPLFPISDRMNKPITELFDQLRIFARMSNEDINELKRQKNNISRKISALKKANLD